MKRLSIFLAALMACTLSFAQTDYSKTYTSNATLTAGDNASAAQIVIGGTSFDGMKAGTSKKAGTIKITVPAKQTNLHIHAIAWKGVTGASVSITGATCTPSTLTLTANDGITGNPPFTISGDMLESYYFNVALTGITADTELTLSCDKRFVVFGVNAVTTADIPATAIALDKETLSLDKGATEQLTAILTPADATTAVVWATENAEIATVEKGLVTAVGVGTTNITATVTPAEGTTYTATCAVTVAAAPDAPVFAVTESVFEGSMDVAISAAEGLAIYYTTDGTEPTAESTLYTVPFAITATTTVKAIAYDATTTKASVVAEQTYTKAMTCAEANLAAKGDKIILGTVTVVYVNGANIYVADATGSTLVFAYDFGLKAGQVVKGLVGTMDIYNGLPEIKPSVTLKDLTISEGTVPEPTTVTTAPVAADVNKYLTIEGVRFDKDYKAFKTRDNANVIVGDTTLVVRNNFTIDFGDLMQAYTYDITGFVCVFKGAVQFYPILIEDITAHGVYTVGVAAEGAEPADFESLAEAFTAYNETAAAGMVTGDVTLQVISDLNEPKNVGIQNPTEYTLTLTVDKAEARTISFSQAADNAGPSGNICIGCDMTLTHESASVESKNIVIDGSFNGSEESYLTIKSVAGCHRLNGPVLIYGNVKNITVKNCQLVAENGTASSIYPVTIRSQKNTDFAPENITIDNNYIEAIQGSSDQGIYFQLTTADKKKPANVTISDNLIKATTRGIFMNGINNATITGNVIMVNQPSAGMLSYGIWGFGKTEGEFIIEGNNIAQLSTGAAADGSGIYGIVANAGKWYIRNNYVSGFNVANGAADNIALVGIQGSSAADTVVIEHNTVAMAEQANKMANASAAKVCLIKPVTAKASVKNNLLVSNENGFANALVASPAGIMESNVYCTKSYVGATEETKDFAAYQTAVEPTAKSVVSVTFEDLANGNLDLVAPSDGDANLGVTRLADVTTDIYGTERGEFTYAGAYQGTTIQPGPGTDVEDINANGAEVQKIVRNGQVLIIRDGKTYNMMGQVVE